MWWNGPSKQDKIGQACSLFVARSLFYFTISIQPSFCCLYCVTVITLPFLSATMELTIRDRYLIKSCETAKVMELVNTLRTDVSNKNVTLIGLKTLTKKTDNTGTFKRLPSCGHRQRTNMHFSSKSYLIILLTGVRDMTYVTHFAALSLSGGFSSWMSARPLTFSMLAEANRPTYLQQWIPLL